MAGSKWFYNSVLDTAFSVTLTGATENTFFPLSNLKHYHTTKEFRTTDLTPAVITYDLADATDIDSFCVVGNRVTGELRLNSVQIEASSTSNFAMVEYDSGVISIAAEGKNDVKETFAYIPLHPSKAFRYWRFTLTNDTGYIGCSNFFLGTELGMTTNAIAYGWDFTRIDKSTVQEGRYGNRFIDRVADQKAISVSFDFLNTTEFQLIEQMTSICGISKPLWLVIDPDEVIVYNANVFSGYFYLTTRPTFTNTAYGLMNTKLELIECI